MCPCLALTGSCGMSRRHVCVDRSVEPCGMWTVNGLFVGAMFFTGASCMTKIAVAPLSRMAQSFGSLKEQEVVFLAFIANASFCLFRRCNVLDFPTVLSSLSSLSFASCHAFELRERVCVVF